MLEKSEYIKKLVKKIEEDFRLKNIDVEKELKKIIKRYEEEGKRKKKLKRKLYQLQISRIEKHKDKKFEISRNFYDAAMGELKRSFMWGRKWVCFYFSEKVKEDFMVRSFMTQIG
jgi:actin-related protein